MQTDVTTKRILALDTANECVSVALSVGDRIDETVNTEPNRHTEQLLILVDEILKRNDVALEALDAVAFGAGPGAFTGLRVACATAQGLAWAKDKPVIGVGNLTAQAFRLQASGVRGRILIANDARMRECYSAAYELTDADVVVLMPECLVAPGEVGEVLLQKQLALATGGGLDAYAADIELPEGVTRLETQPTTAADIARTAQKMLMQGMVLSAQQAHPLYVRNRVALTIDERRAGEKL